MGKLMKKKHVLHNQLKNECKALSGVYFISDTDGQIIYIGQTGNLETRFSVHSDEFSGRQTNLEGYCVQLRLVIDQYPEGSEFFIFPVKTINSSFSSKTREYLEGYLIKELKPIGNKKIPLFHNKRHCNELAEIIGLEILEKIKRING